jgi:hypothetical protein
MRGVWHGRRDGDTCYLTTTRESHIYPRSVFYLYWIFVVPVQITTSVPIGGTNQYKCLFTWSRRRHLPPTRYKCEASTFVPVGATARYKCEHICTNSCCGPIQVCNRYFSFFSCPPPDSSPPSHSSSSSLQLELPLLPDLRRFLHDLTH